MGDPALQLEQPEARKEVTGKQPTVAKRSIESSGTHEITEAQSAFARLSLSFHELKARLQSTHGITLESSHEGGFPWNLKIIDGNYADGRLVTDLRTLQSIQNDVEAWLQKALEQYPNVKPYVAQNPKLAQAGVLTIALPKTDTAFVVTNTAPFQMRDGEVQPSMGMPRAIVDFMEKASGDFHWMYVGDNLFEGHSLQGTLHAVEVTAEERVAHYQQISNEVLWQVMHAQEDNSIRPDKKIAADQGAWQQYTAVCSKVASNINDKIQGLQSHEYPPTIWIHDYQMLAVGEELKILRNGASDIPMGIFWHIPFPEVDMLIAQVGEEKTRQILTWLSAYETIGFHTQEYATNYQKACERFRARAASAVVQPISVDVEGITETAKQLATSKHRFEDPELNRFFDIENIQHETSDQIRLVCGMERCDITKGTLERLAAWKLILTEEPETLRNVQVLEVITPSRMTIDQYRERYERATALIKEVNQLAQEKLGRNLITHSKGIQKREDVVAAGAYSDGFIVTPHRDGFNMSIAEGGTAQLAVGKTPAMLLTTSTGFFQSLRDYGLERAVYAIEGPITPQSIQAGIGNFIQKINNLSENNNVSATEALKTYLQTFTIQNWVKSSLAKILETHLALGSRP